MDDLRSVSRSVSEGPHLHNPRNSMEDADSTATRKRPRLDRGDKVLQTMSTHDSAIAQISSVDHDQLPQDAEKTMITSTVNPETNTDRQLLQSPNKVTINVRDRGVGGTSPSTSLAATGASSPYDSLEQSISSATVMPSTPSRIPTASPTPSRSPEIEVAEPEEFDDDPRNTRWKSLHETNAIEVLRDLLATFPGTSQHRNALAAISHLNASLERGW